MAFTGQNVIDAAHAVLADINNYWLDTYLLGWLNAGLKEIVLLKPNALVMTTAAKCIKGTRQALPVGGLMLIDVTRNMGTDGLTDGRVVTPLSRQSLDSSNPDWHTAVPAAVAKHFVYDTRYPKVFYVYPPQPAAAQGYLEIMYGASPASLTAVGDTIELESIYENVLVDYVAYRAFGRDSADLSHAQAAKDHYAAFVNALGARVQAEAAVSVAMPEGSKARVQQ